MFPKSWKNVPKTATKWVKMAESGALFLPSIRVMQPKLRE